MSEITTIGLDLAKHVFRFTALMRAGYDGSKPNGQLYVMFSSHSDLDLIDKVIKRAGFKFRIAKKYSIFIDSFVLYECIR